MTLPDRDIWSDIRAVQVAARPHNGAEGVEAQGRRDFSLRHSPPRGRRTARTPPRGRTSCSPRSSSPPDAPSTGPLPLTPSQLPADSPVLASGQKRSGSDSDDPTSFRAKRMRSQQGRAGQQLHTPGPALPPAPAAPLPGTDCFTAAGAWEQQAATQRPAGGLPWRLPPTVPGVLPTLQHTGGGWDYARGEGLRGGLAGAAAPPAPQALLQGQAAGVQEQPAPWVSVVGSLLEMMQRCSTPLAEEWASAEAAGVEGLPSGQLTSALAGLLQQAAAVVGAPSQAAPAATMPAPLVAADRVAQHVIGPMQLALKNQQAARDAAMGMDPCSLQRQKAALAMLAVQHGLA